MKNKNNLLIIKQLDKKLQDLRPLFDIAQPPEGWISLIRKTLKMSLRQLASRLSITPQSLGDLEGREKEGTITLKTLREAASALDMKLVYAFVPQKNQSLEQMVESKAAEMARKIVMRTSTTMKLEDQENSKERLEEAIADLTNDIKREMPKTLWD
ncbi:mobile mystery protein A [Puia sp.]|jgi:predicted DNA-binding mobile mystery protein A|uniref:mobile mystery protein A n=1 Tax=Puia sp. TaxID=2045100 RepID=UPI002F42DEDA